MQIFLHLIIIILLTSGCQTISGGYSQKAIETADISIVKAGKSHIIDVEVEQSLKSMLDGIRFYNIAEGKNRYILVSGSIRKLVGVSIDRKKINIRFLNDKGDIVAEKTDRISVSRMRRPTGSKGRFSIKVPYGTEISKCSIAFES